MVNGEPSLAEMLAEPIVQLLMAADGLVPEDVVASVVQAYHAFRIVRDPYVQCGRCTVGDGDGQAET